MYFIRFMICFVYALLVAPSVLFLLHWDWPLAVFGLIGAVYAALLFPKAVRDWKFERDFRCR